MIPSEKAPDLLKKLEHELVKQSQRANKDYTKASKYFDRLFRTLIEKPEGYELLINKLYKLCHEQYGLEVLGINIPSCPPKKDGSSVTVDDIYSQNFDEIVKLEAMIELTTTDGDVITLDLERLSKEPSYLEELKEIENLDAQSIERVKYFEGLKDVKEKLDFILKFDLGDLAFFKGMNEQVEIAKMKKRTFSPMGLTVDLTTQDLLQLPPQMAGLLTRLTTLCHWGTRGPERIIFANTKENIDDMCEVLKNENVYSNLKRFTILGCSTTSREVPEENSARLFVYNGPLQASFLEKMNNNINEQEPNYLFNFYVDDKTKNVKLTLIRLPYLEKKDVLLDLDIDIREFYSEIYSNLPPKSQKQSPAPDKDMSKIAGTVKNMFNMLSPKNSINTPAVPPKSMNPLFAILQVPEVHRLIYKDCGKKTVNGEINLHVGTKKQKAIVHRKNILKEKENRVEAYQAGLSKKEERQQLRQLFPALGKTTVEFSELGSISSETLDLARLAESTINAQRRNTPIEVKGYTVPVTKAKDGDYIVAFGAKEKMAEILAEDIPKSITIKTRPRH
ncbi:MAG: hypothetical protein JSR17_06860 [Proteobacteria bacterium]|nr:hypothetical protein [Pseudomonadota bacterium]